MSAGSVPQTHTANIPGWQIRTPWLSEILEWNCSREAILGCLRSALSPLQPLAGNGPGSRPPGPFYFGTSKRYSAIKSKWIIHQRGRSLRRPYFSGCSASFFASRSTIIRSTASVVCLTLDPSIVGDRFVDPVAFCHTWVLPQGLAGSTCELSGADAAFGQSAMKNNRPAGLIVPTLDTRFQYPRSHTAATDLKPAASARWVFLLLLSGAVSCCCCLSRRCCSRSAREAENLAAHRRSHLLSRSRGILLITQKLRARPRSEASTRAGL